MRGWGWQQFQTSKLFLHKILCVCSVMQLELGRKHGQKFVYLSVWFLFKHSHFILYYYYYLFITIHHFILKQ